MNKKKFLGGLCFFLLVGCLLVGSLTLSQETQHTRQKIEQKSHKKLSVKERKYLKKVKAISEYTEHRLQKSGFTGEALLIKDGKVVYQQGYGYADVDNQVPNGSKTTYQIASLQKSATAMMIMLLANKGKLSLNDHLAKYYPNIKNGNLVTLRQMLNMTSGTNLATMPRNVLTATALVNYVSHKIQINVKQIGHQSYQPANYVLLAGILQKITQHSYEDSFNTMIRKPLKLKNTYFFNEEQAQSQKALAYTQVKGKQLRRIKEQAFQYSNELGTGNLYMSTPDLYKMLSSFLDGKFLTQTETRLLYTTFPPRNNYSAGLYHLAQLPEFKKLGITSGYHVHGYEYGYETVGDLSANGKDAVILQTNVANLHKPFNLVLDADLYHALLQTFKK
ncbi:serine hydrolase domain-containing protein [Liquorilactobacillus satsumensis]|uniref:serine hydrolase domain-containing protein n=2 Tax=Liquorilactobacillus satsumensis TaxID=259059 RepID=UPI001E497DAB|nr:serine hydrolase domain-containing protein [Liquorilactobacillus satsumensis]MCC7666505.1 hypothetical protein [Liquorilactobacillus satsumensis]MCP9357529.1 serine hydrolase [Liquorilactobacillus satsumensis]MCP9371357.1 serine hydrolase [Liquorilactobacillus satsumensis]